MTSRTAAPLIAAFVAASLFVAVTARSETAPTTRPSTAAKGEAGAKAVPAAAQEGAAERPTTRPAAAPSTQPSGGDAKSLTADQMMSRLLKAPTNGGAKPLAPIPDPPAVDRTSGRGAVKPDAPAVNVMREGTFLVDRLGRLTRSADASQAEFTFESDGSALQDPPVLILPNLKLMAMENAVTSSSRDLRFRITGMLTEYRGRNYVLLEKVVVVPDAVQQFPD